MKLAILGGSGVVGHSVLQLAIQKEIFSEVLAPSRTPLREQRRAGIST